MITVRQLSIDNHHQVIELFGDEVDNYYFLINDLISNRYEGENFKLFGEFENGKLVSVLLNNFNNITYYSNANRDVTLYNEMLMKLTFSKISGPSKFINKFIPLINPKKVTLSHMGVVKAVSAKRKYPELQLKIVQTDDEIGMQYDLFLRTEEFVGTLPENKEDYIRKERERLRSTTDRTVYLSVEKQMVASAATIREGKNSAIIIGVFTHPDFRGMGYGTEVLIGLFEMLLNEGKYAYLFYNNPVARSVYKNLGMIEICEWQVAEV
ncbi:GNAT family N-acetyltransferase [Bacillus sp. FJAT-27245]|uniref:GNAT family N-acetyltransferase n=1 Tax=Bacillus sp. FJAT-27245 TaxID=1684144 RepID=UPI000B119FEA|nr:GNAT family N-acetyltransferase [Bacillus sp. FJAT-27245]